MIEVLLGDVAENPWALAVLAGLVFVDGLVVIVPGEIAVTVLGSLAVSHGVPPLWGVVLVAGAAAFAADVAGYAIGRLLHPQRWRIAKRPRFQRAYGWARRRLRTHLAITLFTARFIPFARVVVNLTAGATRIRPSRYLPLAGGSALLWAGYQAFIGAAVATIVPGGPLVGVLVAIAGALAIGWILDRILARFGPR
ncbi:DedA family protein [Microbacterium sp. G2-8]|uniref:DedA family protein n=1 Tax=Microbacterium sp. G2-8 TaxID=2842454 RepID=UPI001C898D9B|nr:VTT domain-containing protein [Microbacterium sp. G2-8]